MTTTNRWWAQAPIATLVVALLAACPEPEPAPTDVDATDTVGADADGSDESGGGADADAPIADAGPDVAPTGCDAIVCAQSEDCVEAGDSASCVPKCGFPDTYDPASQSCVPLPDCVPCVTQARTCDVSDGAAVCGDCIATHFDDGGVCLPLGSCVAGSAQQACGDLHRECVPPSGDTPATCGACLIGFVPVQGQAFCVPAQGCAGDGDCAGDLVCLQVEPSADGGLCMQAPCAAGSAWNRASGSCKACPACAGEGTTGSVWPVTDKNGGCVCQTEPGFFWDPAVASSQAFACDKDGDGWTNEKVAQLLAQASTEAGAAADDLALLLNARCDIAHIDGFVMVNELGQHKTLTLTELGSSTDSLPLFETSRNDRGDATDPMPTHGRPFLPEEANSLTKVCAANIDLNGNGVSDLLEDQRYTGGAAFQKVFNKLGYFTELYTGALVDGKWHIIERSRCDAAFPVGYADDADPYWRSCHRRRASGYPANGPELTYDFARFECDAAGGACNLPPNVPPVSTGITPPPHGVCEELPLVSNTWRGMTHYSQFACVAIRNTQDPLSTGEVALADVRPGQTWVASACALSDDPGSFDCAPMTTDAAVEAAVDMVVWTARGFSPYAAASDYEGGCIDEGTEWSQLCPGAAVDPHVSGTGAAEGFGALSCGCDGAFTYEDAACVDIDECDDADLDPCDANATCSNTFGGVACACNTGFVGDGLTCSDVDECGQGLAGCYDLLGQATCTNLFGGFTCTCPVAYPGDGVSCDDGLAAYYAMDGPLAGSAIPDDSGNGNDGALWTVGNPIVLSVADRFSKPDGAWEIKAVSGTSRADFASFPSGSYTTAVWFEPGDGTTVLRNVSSLTLNSYSVFSTASCGLQATFGAGLSSVEVCVISAPVPVDWHLLVMAFDASTDTYTLTVKGPDGTFTTSATVSGLDRGARLPTGTRYDDLRVFDRVLTPGEIDQLFHHQGYGL